MMLLEGKNLSKRYRRLGQQTDALTDVSFSLAKGEILGIAGMSGSGKSTLLKIVSGLEKADSGELLFKGQPLPQKRTKDHYRAMQMIFQDAPSSFHPRRSIASSIRETVTALRGRQAQPDIAELASLVGLAPELAERLPSALSGGQCQRFAIARAVAVKPEILLCDEITSALDVSTQAVILQLITRICRTGNMSALFVSHDLAVLSCVCDRIMIMNEGRVVEEGATRKIIEAPQEDYTRKLLSCVLEISNERDNA